ncbi:GPI transamidase component PIG-S-like [Acropora palmata]|uniref:GPI transamidase component PIG-S-like n=1 Tax=Acropora palmata TaxID=6131 RepID=UPI003DA05249
MADSEESLKKAHSEKRIQALVSLSVGFIFILIGIPLWWNTTKVYRASLPYSEIEQLNSLKVKYATVINVMLFGPQDPVAMKEAIEKELRSETGYPDSVVFAEYKVTVDDKHTEILTSKLSSQSWEDLDDFFHNLFPAKDNHFTFFVLPHESPEPGSMDAFIGKYLHCILYNNKDLAQLAATITMAIKSIIVNEEEVSYAFSLGSKREMKKDTMENMTAQKSITGLQVSFTLVNSDPDSVLAEWDIEPAVKKYLDPFLVKFPHLDITVDSQVLHYSTIQINPRKDGESFYLPYDDLPHMINPIEAKLGSHISFYPTLNFVVYVPLQKYTPLYMRTKEGGQSKSNAFLSPQWGGVLIYNLQRTTSVNGSSPQRIGLDMKPVMNIFLSQLKHLLGLIQVKPVNGIKLRVSTDDNSVSKWEQDSLMRLKTMEYLATSTITLTSLAQLLGKISNMVINDHIKEQVERALYSITQSTTALEEGNLTGAVLAAKMAIRSSEEAFFDPSILELLYFPDDQKYAIYIPLFLPISLPVILSLRQALRWYRGENDEKKDKQD